jgi:hypothetical protein
MTDIATMNRINEILAEYDAQKAELLAVDFTEEIEREVAAFRERLVEMKQMDIKARLRDIEVSIMAVERVKANLLIEEEVGNATTEQSDTSNL